MLHWLGISTLPDLILAWVILCGGVATVLYEAKLTRENRQLRAHLRYLRDLVEWHAQREAHPHDDD